MKYSVIAIAVYVFYSYVLSNYFISLPQISKTSSALLVGGANPSHADYIMGAPTEVTGTVVDYSFNSFGISGSFLDKFGARGIISTLPPQEYKKIVATQKQTGQCMASLLNDSIVEHLELIPESKTALRQMRKANLSAGKTYQLSGRYLILKNASLDGHPFSLDMGGSHFFLVESIH